MRKSVMGVAVVALLGTTALVSAQQPEPRGQPSAKEQGPAPGGAGAEKGAERAPSADNGKSKGGEMRGKSADRAQSDDAAGKGDRDKAGRGKSTAQRGKDDDGATKGRDRDRADRSGKSDRQDRSAKDEKADRDRKRADRNDRDDAKQGKQGKRAEDKADDRKRKSARDDNRDRQRDQAKGKDDDRQRDQARGKGDNRQRADLPEKKREQVRDKLRSHREARVTNVDFSINIGTRVPRNFRALHVLPTDIVSIVPAYRGYRYFIVNDRICIVNPRSYEIVEVIYVDGGPRRGGAVSASLDLTRPQISLILDRISLDHVADVNVDLALGAEVPASVELYDFPRDVIVDVPAVQKYRYVVLRHQVLVVDPSQRDVVFTIDR